MTRDEILNMKAGRELDALVAEKVMGFHKVDEMGNLFVKIFENNGGAVGFGTPPYSTNIQSAWEVAEKLGSFWIDHTVSDLGIDVEFFTSLDHSKERLVATADTAPLAICRAALLAVMEDENV